MSSAPSPTPEPRHDQTGPALARRRASAAKRAPSACLPPEAALLLIDLQKAIDAPIWGRRNNPGAEAVAARLLAAWRASGRPVIHVQHLSRDPASPYRPGQADCEFKDEVRPQAGEIVVQKETNNAFIETGLDALLRDRKVRALVVAGVLTNNSVEATVRMAGNLGYETYLVEDATATVDTLDLDGHVWQAEQVQALSLANLDGEYATVVDSGSVLAMLSPTG